MLFSSFALMAPAVADEPAPPRSATVSIALSLTIPPRPGISTSAMCRETRRSSSLLRVTDASGTDLPDCDTHSSRIESANPEPGVQTLLVTPV